MTSQWFSRGLLTFTEKVGGSVMKDLQMFVVCPVELHLKRPLMPVQLSPEQVGLEMLCLCGQLDLLIRAQMQQVGCITCISRCGFTSFGCHRGHMFRVFNISSDYISCSIFLETEKFFGHKTQFLLLISVFFGGLQQAPGSATYLKNYILNLQYVFIPPFYLNTF